MVVVRARAKLQAEVSRLRRARGRGQRVREVSGVQVAKHAQSSSRVVTRSRPRFFSFQPSTAHRRPWSHSCRSSARQGVRVRLTVAKDAVNARRVAHAREIPRDCCKRASQSQDKDIYRIDAAAHSGLYTALWWEKVVWDIPQTIDDTAR